MYYKFILIMLLEINTKAPEFILPDENGNMVSLSNFKNSMIVLWFYPKANTPGWIIEGKGFRDEFQKFKDLNTVIVGVSADSVKKQKNFCDKQKFPFSLLSNSEHDMLKKYKVWGKKKFMGREYMGISRVTYIINESGIIKYVFQKVKTMSHAKDVLKILSDG